MRNPLLQKGASNRVLHSNHVLHGGSWITSGRVARVSFRFNNYLTNRYDNFGFRLFRNVK